MKTTMSNFKMPCWYKTPTEQVETLREVMQKANVYHELATEFEACANNISDIASVTTSPTQVLILAFYLPDKGGKTGFHRTMQMLWDMTAEFRWLGRVKDKLDSNMWIALKYEWKPSVRWVLYDYAAYQGLSSSNVLELSAIDDKQLATIEPLLIAVTNRDYVNALDYNRTLCPKMPALKFADGIIGTQQSPSLHRCRNKLEMVIDSIVGYQEGTCSPTIQAL